MVPHRVARIVAGRIHYAWIIVAVMFTVILATVGVRAAPGVLIVPLEQAFGWNAATISGAISLNILLGAWSDRSAPRSSSGSACAAPC